MVAKWRSRFLEHRLDGLTDEPRPGRPRTVTDEQVEEVIVRTLETTPKRRDALVDALDGPRGRAHAVGGAADLEGVRAAAAPPGHLEALQGPAVHREGPRRRRALPEPARARGRALRRREVPDPGARPHRADPADAARARPSARRTTTSAPGPRASTPRWTSPPARSSARCTAATARSSSRSSCRRIDREVPAELDVHLVLDNSSTHKTPAIQRWLAAHPRFVLHFTPDHRAPG